MGHDIIDLFPTPLLRAQGVLPMPLVQGLVDHFSAVADRANHASAQLVHSRMLSPRESPLLGQAAQLITPSIVAMGEQMFGQSLGWSIKEMWVNLLDTGGRQAMHNHANSFISGVVYLTATHRDAQTVFIKAPGGTDFAFRNEHVGTSPTRFSAGKWVSPAPAPGDLLLFPSYLMHEVPPNPGPRRISLAFNAIPTRLDSWGYAVSFSG